MTLAYAPLRNDFQKQHECNIAIRSANNTIPLGSWLDVKSDRLGNWSIYAMHVLFTVDRAVYYLFPIIWTGNWCHQINFNLFYPTHIVIGLVSVYVIRIHKTE